LLDLTHGRFKLGTPANLLAWDLGKRMRPAQASTQPVCQKQGAKLPRPAQHFDAPHATPNTTIGRRQECGTKKAMTRAIAFGDLQAAGSAYQIRSNVPARALRIVSIRLPFVRGHHRAST
jgi:hypothetical protein